MPTRTPSSLLQKETLAKTEMERAAAKDTAKENAAEKKTVYDVGIIKRGRLPKNDSCNTKSARQVDYSRTTRMLVFM